jgi:hypothetical protein
MPAGRPTKYTPKVAQLICDLLADGKSLIQITSLQEMPGETTVRMWLRRHAEFRRDYARARRWQARYYAEQMIEIADDVSEDATGELRMPNAVAVNRAKLRIDTRKWIAAKLLPKKYGDSQTLKAEHSGSVGIQLVHSVPQPTREQ